MLLIAVGVGFLLLFTVLISDGISTGTVRRSITHDDVRDTDGGTTSETPSAADSPPSFGERGPADGTDLAA